MHLKVNLKNKFVFIDYKLIMIKIFCTELPQLKEVFSRLGKSFIFGSKTAHAYLSLGEFYFTSATVVIIINFRCHLCNCS